MRTTLASFALLAVGLGTSVVSAAPAVTPPTVPTIPTPPLPRIATFPIRNPPMPPTPRTVLTPSSVNANVNVDGGGFISPDVDGFNKRDDGSNDPDDGNSDNVIGFCTSPFLQKILWPIYEGHDLSCPSGSILATIDENGDMVFH